MNKLIIKLKYKNLLKKFSFAKRKKICIKFDNYLKLDLDFVSIIVNFKDNLFNLDILQGSEHIKTYKIIKKDIVTFTPDLRDLSINYIFILK